MGRTKRGRESTVAGTATPVSTPRKTKKPRTSIAVESPKPPSGPDVEYQLAGSSRSWTCSLKSSLSLNQLIVRVADNLKIPLYGTLIRFTQVKEDGGELEIYDEYDFKAFRQEVIDSGARRAVIRVYSASGSTLPVYSTPINRNTSLRRQSHTSTSDFGDRTSSVQGEVESHAEGSRILNRPPNFEGSSSSEDELFPPEPLQRASRSASPPLAPSQSKPKKRRRSSKHLPIDIDPDLAPPPIPKLKQLHKEPPQPKSKTVKPSPMVADAQALPKVKATVKPGKTVQVESKGAGEDASSSEEDASSSEEESDEDSSSEGAPPDAALKAPREESVTGAGPASHGDTSAEESAARGTGQHREDTDNENRSTSKQSLNGAEDSTHPAENADVPFDDSRQTSNDNQSPDDQPIAVTQDFHSPPRPAVESLPLPNRKVISLSLFEPKGILANQPESKPGSGLRSSSSFRWSSSDSENELGLSLEEESLNSSEHTTAKPSRKVATSAPDGGHEDPASDTEFSAPVLLEKKKRNRKKAGQVAPASTPAVNGEIAPAADSAAESGALPDKPKRGATGKKRPPKAPQVEEVVDSVALIDVESVHPEAPTGESAPKKTVRRPAKGKDQRKNAGEEAFSVEVDLQPKVKAAKRQRKGQVAAVEETVPGEEDAPADQPSAIVIGSEAPQTLVEASSPRSTSPGTDGYFTPNEGLQRAQLPSSELVLKSQQGQVQHRRLQNRAPCIICGSIPSHLQKDCPVVKAGVNSLRKLLAEREAEQNPQQKSVTAILAWINRLTKIHEKVNGAVTRSYDDSIPQFAPPIKASTLAAFNERDPSPPPPPPPKTADVVARSKGFSEALSPEVIPRVPEPPSLPAIFHRALVKAGRPGSQSGLSVSDAVIETGSSASESDSEIEQDGSSEDVSSEEADSHSENDADPALKEDEASDTESTVSISSGDAVRHFLSKPLSAKEQRKARESAASMSASQPLVTSDEESDHSETGSDADEDVVINIKTRRAGSADSSIGDFEHEGHSAAETSPGSRSDILPVTQPPEIALAQDEIEPAESVDPVPLEQPAKSINDAVSEQTVAEDLSSPKTTTRSASRQFGALDAILGPSPVMANFPGHNALQEIIMQDNDDEAFAGVDREQPIPAETFQATQIAKTAHGLPSPPSSIHDSANGDAARAPSASQTSDQLSSQKTAGALAPPASIRSTRSASRSARSVSRDVTKSPVRMTRAMSREVSHPVSPNQRKTATPSTPRRTRGRSAASEHAGGDETAKSPVINASLSSQPQPRVLRSSQVDELESSQPPEGSVTPKQRDRMNNDREKQSSPLFFTQSQVPSTQTYNAVPPQTQSFNHSVAKNPSSDIARRSSVRITSPIAEEDEEDHPSAASGSDSVSEAASFASAPEPDLPRDRSSQSRSPRASPTANGTLEPPSGSESDDDPPIVTIRTRPQIKAAASQPLISIPSLSSLSKEHLRGRSSQPALTTQSQPVPKLAVESDSSNDDEDSSSDEDVPPKSAALRSRFANGNLRKRRDATRPNGQLKGW